MTVKRICAALAGLAFAAGPAAAAAPAGHLSLVIRHQLRGCHSWAVNGGAFDAQQAVALRRGGSITITNNDVMPHRLMEKSGPTARLSGPPLMGHMGAMVKLTFPRPGSYRFTTKAGEDYVRGIKTIGEDNVLLLTVTVS
jgi:hypothetical protein